jgi:glycosyltransferase involved in cell wall biosynthesis
LQVERRPRVLFAITRFLDGGSERRCAAIIGALTALGYEVTLVVGVESDLARIRELCGPVQVQVEPSLRRALNPLQDLLALLRFQHLISRDDYDAVFTCQSKAGVLGRLAARLAGVPVVCHSLSMANFGTGFGRAASRLYRLAEQMAGRWTDAYFVVGHDLQRRYVEAGIGRPERYHVVRSPIDLAAFEAAGRTGRTEARAALGLDPARPVVAYVGSLEERKGVLELPQFLEQLKQGLPVPPVLVIAGDGEMHDALERRLKEVSLLREAILLGRSRRVPEVMAAADCLVLLSRAEGLAQVLVQAAAARTPFVTYAADGTAELLERGLSGKVVASGDLGAAVDAARELMQKGRPGPVDLGEWDASFVSQQLSQLLMTIMGGGAAADERVVPFIRREESMPVQRPDQAQSDQKAA